MRKDQAIILLHKLEESVPRLHLGINARARALGEIGRYHFILSSDPMRLMTVPFTLNGETGKICFYVGGPREFEKLTFQEILRRSDARQYVYDNGFRPLHSHLEPLLRIRR